jgi:ketosteroid isomerase-like protein
MKNLLTKTALLSIVFMASVILANAQSDAELKSKIEKLNLEIGAAMVSGDYEKSLSFYTKDIISLPNYQPMLNGIEAVKQSNEEMKKAGWSVTAFKINTHSVMSCNNLVTEIGTFEISFAMKGMDEPMTDVGKYITIWEKQKDGSLKIRIETWNTDKYPAREEKK